MLKKLKSKNSSVNRPLFIPDELYNSLDLDTGIDLPIKLQIYLFVGITAVSIGAFIGLLIMFRFASEKKLSF